MEDPWENYMFYDAKKLIPLICHREALSIAEQVLLVKFIAQTVENETISQYKIAARDILRELIQFANNFETAASLEEDIIDEDEDEVTEVKENLLTRIDKVLQENQGAEELDRDI